MKCMVTNKEVNTNLYIFGNSPNCNIAANISLNDDVVVLGNGIKSLKHKKINYWFTRIGKFEEPLCNFADRVFILDNEQNKKITSNNVRWITNDVVQKYTSQYKLNINPTLGLFSILYLKDAYRKIFISGFTLNVNDKYMECGYFWDKQGTRNNKYHCMWKEMVFLNKLLSEGVICEF